LLSNCANCCSAQTLGLVSTAQAPGFLIGSPIAGQITSAANSYTPAFEMSAAVLAFSTLFMVWIGQLKRSAALSLPYADPLELAEPDEVNDANNTEGDQEPQEEGGEEIEATERTIPVKQPSTTRVHGKSYTSLVNSRTDGDADKQQSVPQRRSSASLAPARDMETSEDAL
jgi:hypothetical protein